MTRQVNPDSTFAVTPARPLDVDHRGDRGWPIREGTWPTHVQGPNYPLPSPAYTGNPGFSLEQACIHPTEQSWWPNGESVGLAGAAEGPVWSETTADVQEEHAWGHVGNDEGAYVRLEVRDLKC